MSELTLSSCPPSLPMPTIIKRDNCWLALRGLLNKACSHFSLKLTAVCRQISAKCDVVCITSFSVAKSLTSRVIMRAKTCCLSCRSAFFKLCSSIIVCFVKKSCMCATLYEMCKFVSKSASKSASLINKRAINGLQSANLCNCTVCSGVKW